MTNKEMMGQLEDLLTDMQRIYYHNRTAPFHVYEDDIVALQKAIIKLKQAQQANPKLFID